jgi:hypothetical protein
MLLKKGTQK